MNLEDLRKMLEKRIEIIEDHRMRDESPDEQLQLLQKVSEDLDLWRELHRNRMNKRLLHFLDNYSYTKALDFINDERSRC